MMTCKICGNEIKLLKSFHYIARDEVTTGIVNIGKHEEELLYDAFDCPVCGCQNIVGERKRGYISTVSEGHPDGVAFVEKCDETAEEDETERIKQKQKVQDKDISKCFGEDYNGDELDCALCTEEKECKKAFECKKALEEDKRPDCFGTEVQKEECATCQFLEKCSVECGEKSINE